MPIESYANNPKVIIGRGPVVMCVIGLPIAKPQPQATEINVGELHQVGALLDTGASNCCINPSLANRLNLPISGYDRPSMDASGNTINGRLRNGCLGFIIKQQIVRIFSAVQFFELPKDLPNHTVIIGRTMMANFKSMYFTFRTGEYMIHF